MSFLYLIWYALCHIVIEFRYNRNSLITSCTLEVAVIVHPLSSIRIKWICLLIESIIKITPCSILILIITRFHIIDNDIFCLSNNLFSCWNIHSSINNLTEHVYPRIIETREPAPVTLRVSSNCTVVKILEIFCPYQLRTIPYGTTILTCLFHYGTYASCYRIFTPTILSCDIIQSSIPTAVVITYTIVLCQTCNKWTETYTFVVIEAR